MGRNAGTSLSTIIWSIKQGKCHTLLYANITNEMYARDISKKIKSALETRMKNGMFIGAFAPYGYKRDEKDKHTLVVDSNSGMIVKHIFKLAVNGLSPLEIAKKLNKENIATPLEYRESGNIKKTFYQNKNWSSSTITKILRNKVYLGILQQGKSTKLSIKTKSLQRPENMWHQFKNSHEAIITKKQYDLVSIMLRGRRCKSSKPLNNIFSGLIYCADCGHRMTMVGSRDKSKKVNMACSNYKVNGSKNCTNHFVCYDDLCNVVLKSIKRELKAQDVEIISSRVKNKIKEVTSKNENFKEIEELKKRQGELDNIIQKIYDDFGKKKLDECRVDALLDKYMSESKEITIKLQNFTDSRTLVYNENYVYNEVLKIIDTEQLTRNIIIRLIDKIEVCQGTYEESNGKKYKNQNIIIYYKFKGQSKTYTVKV